MIISQIYLIIMHSISINLFCLSDQSDSSIYRIKKYGFVVFMRLTIPKQKLENV